MAKPDWLNRQFLPGIDQRLNWIRSPIGWLLVAALGSVVAAMTLAPQMWLVFGALLTLIVLGVVWPIIAIWAVDCQLMFDRRRCVEKSQVRVRLLITNKLWFPLWGLTLEKGFFDKQTKKSDDQIATALARIPASSTTEFVWEYEPQNRGVYPSEVPDISCAFPFGLWTARKQVRSPEELIVWPSTFKLGSIPPAIGRNQLVSETFSDRSGTVGDRIGLRPFREGDSLRLVRWAQSARYDQLIVSERQSSSRQMVTISICPLVQKDCEGFATIEDCIRVGASICHEFHSHGYLLRVLVGSQSVLIDARSSTYRLFMDRLARIDLSSTGIGPNLEMDLTTTESSALFVVTNSAQRIPGKYSEALRILVNSGDDLSAESVDPWISVTSGDQLKTEFPKAWVRECHSSWQVSG